MEVDNINMFEFEEGEDYKMLCGKVYYTTKGRIMVYCNLCTLEYSFENYVSHLSQQHKSYSKIFGKNTNQEKLISKINSTIIPFIKSEQSYEDEVLMEEEISMAQLRECSERLEVNLEIENETEIFSTNIKVSSDNVINTANKVATNERSPSPKFAKNESKFTLNNDNYNNSLGSNNYLLDRLVIPSDIRGIRKHVYRRETAATKKFQNEKREYKCPICTTAFKEKSNLFHHFKRHSKEKQHQCTDCEKKFYTTSELKTHMQYHSDKRDFLCSDCGQAFHRKANLIRHTKRHTNQRDYKCSQCNMAFFDGSILARHLQSHSTERPIACPQCPATFPYKTSLRNHLKIHENKREYKCLICYAGFNQKAGLFSHMKIVHKAN